MSFLSAISVIALVAMLPVLLFLRGTALAGVQEFSAACALSAAAVAASAVASALEGPIAAIFGYAVLAAAFFFVLQGFRGLLALSTSSWVYPMLAFGSGMAGFVVALGGPDSLAARTTLVVGFAAALLLVAGLVAVERSPDGKSLIRTIIVGSAVVSFTALFPVLGPSPESLPGHPYTPAAIAFEFVAVSMRVLFLPVLFLAVILIIQARVIAGLRAAIARDSLTGALSRGALIEAGEKIFADCLARRRPAAFLLLDLDFFKQINDHYGHACGDMALAHFAEVVSTFLGERGVLGRIGGEEFGIVLPDHTEEQARALAEEICRVVRETPAGRSHQRIRLTVSIGIATAAAGDTITDVMIRADLALYDSKAEGRDRCSIARDHRIDASARVLAAAAAHLREARTARSELRHTA